MAVGGEGAWPALESSHVVAGPGPGLGDRGGWRSAGCSQL